MNKKMILLKIPYDYRIIYENEYQTKLLVKKDDLKEIVQFFIEEDYEKKIVKYEYRYIYGMMQPIYMVNDGGDMFIIQTALDCLSLTDGIIIPLDSVIQESAWRSIYFDNNYKYIDVYLKVLIVITDCVFRKRMFFEQDQEFINKNIDKLKNIKLVGFLEKIFFGFTDVLIKSIMDGEYEVIVSKYIKYADY